VEEIEEDRVNASFRNGGLTMALCKSARAQCRAKRIAIYEVRGDFRRRSP
jgi:hypothetical protein